jgi:predicted nucleotidyltransferase
MTVSHDPLAAEIGRRLIEAAPDAQIVLFGSRARGDSSADSDLDILVIEPELTDRRREFVRLRRKLMGLGVPIDLVVVSRAYVERWEEEPGTMVSEALREGRVLAGSR